MRHLCGPCAGLESPSRDELLDVKVSELRWLTSDYDINRGLAYLLDSAAGASTGRPCHLCALLLRSLRDHRQLGTTKEESSLPSGVLKLCLHRSAEGYTLVIHCGGTAGFPLSLCFDSDESCRGSDVAGNPATEQVFSQIQSWVNDCIGKHSRCSIARSPMSWLPSRVIDLGPPDETSLPKLLETKGSVGQYITLTHRWTKLTRPSATICANYESRKDAIDPTSLSLTFQDAFEATRKLGVRYLWIDALCIIQDSAEDWAREASNMRSIYELAWLNLAVAGSETEQGRIFMPRLPRLSRACKVPDNTLPEGSPGSKYAYLPSQFLAKSVLDGFLTRRGWILQERILSPRTIYFGQEEVFWECSQTTASETIPWGWVDETSSLVKFNSHDLALNPSGLFDTDILPRHYQNDSPTKYRRMNATIIESFSRSPQYSYWYRLVESYTSKDLTKAQDRLPAISGLAQAIHKSGMPHQVFLEVYQDGIWLSEAPSLLWYLKSDSRGTSTSIEGIPSWSWASRRGPCGFVGLKESFVKEQEPISEAMMNTLGGHPGSQVASISIPRDSISDTSRQGSCPNPLRVSGQTAIATLRISNHWSSEAHEDKVLCSLSFQDDAGMVRVADAMIDDIQDPGMKLWQNLSDDTVWILKLAVCKDIVKDNSCEMTDAAIHLPWMKQRTEKMASFDGYHEYGLVLVPTTQNIEALRNLQRSLEAWNLPKTQEVGWCDRAPSPPLTERDPRRWMAPGQRRVEVAQLLGPHNASFRRVGIYRCPVSSWEFYSKHLTDVILA